MELAVAQGFDVRVVALPPGLDPADDPAAFQAQLAHRDGRTSSTARSSRRGAPTTGPRAPRAVTAFLDAQPASLEKDEAWRWANDYFGTTAAAARPAGGTASAAAAISPKVLAAGERLERDALAGVVAYPELKPLLAEVKPEHFHDEAAPARSARTSSTATPLDGDGVALLAELDARAAERGDRRRRRHRASALPSASERSRKTSRPRTSRGRGRSRSRSCNSGRRRPTCADGPRFPTDRAPSARAASTDLADESQGQRVSGFSATIAIAFVQRRIRSRRDAGA